MIKSMTGFATEEEIEGDLTVAVDMRSYNHRYLDIVLRLASNYAALEEKVKMLVARHVVRGRLELKIQIRSAAEGAVVFEVEWDRARAMHAALSRLKNELGLEGGIELEHLLGAGGMIKAAETANESDLTWPTVEKCLLRALANLEAMRCKEGDFIRKDLSGRLDYIEACLSEIEAASKGLPDQYQKRLVERITALSQETLELDPARLAQEAAYLADRSDISEEIVRVASHVNQFRHIMRSAEPGGRKLNFLLQELHREFNTIGSKIGNADVAHRIVDVKSELEKIREQIQNVE